jgi:pilus assembly protein CpaB
MRPRTLLLVGLAIILAVGTAMLARSWLAAQRNSVVAEAAAPAAPKPANQVLVARNDITRGQILRPQDLTWLAWPVGGVDHNYIVQGSGQGPEKFAGWVALNPISGGEPISTSKIVAPGDRGYLAAVLQPGMRAISVPVTLTSGISGLVFPGDRVDLLMTFNVPQQQQDFGDNAPRQASFDHKATETVLRNIRVIAIDQRLDSKVGEAVLAHTATFEVSPKQSEVIALASELGRVSLTLRSLATAPQDPAATGETGPAASDTMATDSAIGDHATYTVDSEISPLLPKVSGSTQSVAGNVVTILRGTAKASEFRAPESAPKGS